MTKHTCIICQLKGEQKNAQIFKIQIARLVLMVEKRYALHTVRTAMISSFWKCKNIPVLRIVQELRVKMHRNRFYISTNQSSKQFDGLFSQIGHLDLFYQLGVLKARLASSWARHASQMRTLFWIIAHLFIKILRFQKLVNQLSSLF